MSGAQQIAKPATAPTLRSRQALHQTWDYHQISAI
jgi:hypothetical protein